LGNTDAKAQWALSVLEQALSRNITFLTGCTINSRAGPCTKMLLYENAVGMMNIVVSGASYTVGVRSAGGRLVDYLTPLEHEFTAKLYKASAQLTRSEANEIAKVLIPRYTAQLRSPPDGKSYHECYDQTTHEPTAEWSKIHNEVFHEMQELGIPMD
jgi:methylamine--corrinoid protein Co-methyltransferase